MNRDELKLKFLKNNNLASAQRILLKQDASHRIYERIIKDNGETLVLMDAPPTKEKVEPFIHIAKLLRNHNLSAPEVQIADIKNGFLILEDFGDESFTNILSGKSLLSNKLEEEEMYTKAIDAIVHLHKLPSNSSELPHYNENLLVKESLRFIDYYLNVLSGENISKTDKEEFTIIIKHLVSLAKAFGDVVVLRDYHADNLMWLHERDGHNQIGLLDFQDAVIGSPVYDLVSLLEDARRDVSSSTVEKMLHHYLKHFPAIPRKEFSAAYAIYGIQRNLKIIGTFARLATLHRNKHYLSMLPRVWKHVNNNLKHPLLLPLKKWMQKILPMHIK